jgi:hypothetical protein
MQRNHLQQRPAGAAAAIGFGLVCVLSVTGVDLSSVEAAGISGGLAALISLFTPREEFV